MLKRRLHVLRIDWRDGEQKAVCSAGLTATDNKGQLHAPDFLDKKLVVERVLIDVDTAPATLVVLVNRNYSERPLAR